MDFHAIASRLAHSVKNDMRYEAIQMGITRPAGMSTEEATQRAKALLPCKTREVELDAEEADLDPVFLSGTVECERGYYKKNPDGAKYGPDDAGVVVEWETP